MAFKKRSRPMEVKSVLTTDRAGVHVRMATPREPGRSFVLSLTRYEARELANRLHSTADEADAYFTAHRHEIELCEG